MRQNFIKFKNYFVPVLFICISATLTYIWFHKGLIIALGESAIPFYNPQNVLYFYGQTWTPLSLGYFPGTTMASIPFFMLANFLWQLGIPGFLVQAIFFLLFSLLGMIGSYLLFSSIFHHKDGRQKVIGVVTALFYLLNQISLVIAFNRMEYPFTLFYLSIPFALFFFASGIAKKSMKYVLYFNIALLPFASAFVTLPFLELFWLVLGMYTIFSITISWKLKNSWKFAVAFFFSCLVLWIICNLWWFPAVIQYALFTPHPAYNVKGDIGTFNILSEDQGNLSYVFRLMNQHFLESMIPTWGKTFFSPIVVVISYFLPFLAFLPLLFKRKPVIIYFFLGLALVGVFLTKGSAGPFGQFFLFLFSYSTLLQVFRNSFEKIGLLLPIAYAPLIAYSLWTIFNWIQKRYNKTLTYSFLTAVMLLLCGVLVYPFWNGLVFTYNLPPASNPSIGDYVQVPEYYDKANAYLAKDPSDTRILALPMGGEGITTTWEHPYNGVEYTNGLLGRSAISYTTIMPNLEEITTQLNTTFLREPQYIKSIMRLLDAKYLLVRSDVDYIGRLMPNPALFNKLAEEGGLPGIIHTKKFGKLNFFVTANDPQKIYIANNMYAANKSTSFADVFALTRFEDNDVIINTGESVLSDNFARNYSKSELFKPNYLIDYSSYPGITLDNAQTMLPDFYRFLPHSFFYRYEIIKEYFERLLKVDEEDKMFYDMDILSRRIGELQKSILDRDYDNILLTQKNYKMQLQIIQSRAKSDYSKEIIRNIDNFRYRIVGQEVILDNLIKTVPEEKIQTVLLPLRNQLSSFAIATHAQSAFDHKLYLNEEKKRIVYQFDLPEQSDYTFFLKDSNFSTYYEKNDKNWTVIINNSPQTVIPIEENGWLSFGRYHLRKGFNEIHLFTPTPKNLIQTDTTQVKLLVGNSTTKQEKESFSINPFDPTAPYKITFDYRLNVSGGARIQAESEFDTIQNGKYIPEWATDLGKTPDNTWTKASNIVYPFSTASKQTISFVVNPVNNCLRDNQGNAFALDRCEKDKKFHDRYNEETRLEVKNIRVERVFSNTVLLERTNNAYSGNNEKPSVVFHRVDAANYTVQIKNARKPFFLVFDETYYPDWQAIFTDTNKKIIEKDHFLVNTYANAWYITRTGSYTIKIAFAHEKLFLIGKLVSIPVIVISIGIILILHVKRKR